MEDLEALPVSDQLPGSPTRSRRRPASGAGALVATAVVAAAAGGLLTAALVSRGASAPVPAGSGFVWSCQHATTAVVRFDGLDTGRMFEVHVDLRGDIALLPVTGEAVEVTTGQADGHQAFRPSRGELALLVPLLARPPHRARLVDASDGSAVLDIRLPRLSC